MANHNLAKFLKALDTGQLLGRNQILHRVLTIRNYTVFATQLLDYANEVRLIFLKQTQDQKSIAPIHE